MFLGGKGRGLLGRTIRFFVSLCGILGRDRSFGVKCVIKLVAAVIVCT